MENTNYFSVNVTLHIIPKDCLINLMLPVKDLKAKLQEMCGTDDVYSNIRIVDFKSSCGLEIAKGENLLFLNSLLEKIQAHDDETKKNLYDLFLASEFKYTINLFSLEKKIKHYEIFDCDLHGIEETKRVAGGLFYLALAADCAISSDADGTLTNEYRYNFYRAGLSSGAIKVANNKYYVMDGELVREYL